MSEIGNQQVSLEEIAWLAGIIDGEGSIGMRYNKWNNQIRYSTELAITNSCPLLLEKVYNICKKLGVNLYIRPKRSDRKRKCWATQTLKQTDIIKILNPLKHMLTTKKQKATFVLAFCKRRLILNKRSKSKATNANPYNKIDKWYFDKFRELHMFELEKTQPQRLSFME